jgi:pimeloyl-ACP methyl ester carboxylesterase
MGRTGCCGGERPGIRVTGLAPRSEATLETYRVHAVDVNKAGQWSTEHPLFHATARFWADETGAVDVDRAAPVTGTYSGIDPRGLLWSGAVVGRAPEGPVPTDMAGVQDLKENRTRLVLRIGGKIVASRDFTLVGRRDDVELTTVDTPELVGVFAAPKGALHAPTVIILHGSEGGTLASVQASAALYASRGYAAFGLVYFSWPYQNVANSPKGFVHLPVERIAIARDWLKTRREADPERLGLVGASKGSEFALLAASTYPWIRAVVACVPTSVVWGGFGAPLGEHGDSFTLGGKSVPFLAYGDYAPVEQNLITSAERHIRDRLAADSATVQAATIPVEQSRAKMLLISGGRDAVWPSDPMSAEIMDRLAAKGRAGQAQWLSFPDAGHFLCGTGDTPIRYHENEPPMMGGGLVSANGRDGGSAWERTLAFLAANLGR